ncbi:MAG: hypothetical protein EOO69_02580 [Moraxellaceae bacterium]|nr:MAG: hypothetical protein EOO69_02580 [Moraxellaceae bacterium]
MMKTIDNTVKNAAAPFQRNITVICQQNKELYLTNPKLIQRLPKEQRAYWYWFLKHHNDTESSSSTIH